MGKKAIKRIILVSFTGLAAFGVLANDVLHVSAPILAVELGGSEAFPNVQEFITPNSGSSFHKPSEIENANQADVSPSSLSSEIPAAEETKEPIAVDQEPEIKSDIDETLHETGKQIPDRSVLFTSDWFEISSSMIEKVNHFPGETKTSRKGLASGSEVGTLAGAALEPAKPEFRFREPLFSALKASRPLLFGTIVNRKVQLQPIRPVLSSLRQLNAEIVSATKAEAAVEYMVAVKHDAKTPLVFSTALYASAPRLATETAASRYLPPILEGPNAIDLTIFPRVAPRAVAVSVPTTISTVTHKSTPQQIFDFASQRESSSIVEGLSSVDLNVFPRLATKSGPAVVSAIPSISVISESRPMFALTASPTSSPILEGPSAIDLTIFPRLATKSLPVLPVAVPYSVVSSETRTAAAKTAFRPVPVLISGHAAFSQAMLRPLGSMAQQSDEPVADLFVASNRGPSADSFTDRQDTRRAALGSAKLPTASSPVLITGQFGFSTEMLKPLNSKPVQAKPFNVSTPVSSLPISGRPKQVAGYCDPGFVGEPIRFSQTVELKLEDLLNQLNARFGINFIIGPNVGKIPLNVKAGSIPWNVLLRSQLFVSGVRARCIDPTTIELVLNRDLPTLQDEGAVTTRFVKLKFFQRTSGGTVDLANRSQGGQNGGQGGCGGSGGAQSGGTSSGGSSGSGQGGQTAGQLGNNRFDKLILEIEKILGIRPMVGGGSGGGATNSETEEIRTNRFVTQIPGRNILVIRASDEEHELIDQIIARADRPPFQVVIKALVYSANQDRLQDIGGQVSITGGTGNSKTLGGIFGHTVGTGTLFDFSTIIGTFDFNVQFTALQQNGVVSVKSRPFSTVIDGLCTTLNVGRELPIVIDSTLGGQGDVVFVNAANRLAVTPYVIDDENGNPVAVTLELSLDANDIDSSVTTRGVPAVSRRSIQTQLLLGEDKTAILGGFTVDQDSKTISKTPGLGNIPIIGELFKRRIRDTRLSRLYFAISASIVPYPEAIAPVQVPGATTDPQTVTQEMKKRAEEAEATPKKKKDN